MDVQHVGERTRERERDDEQRRRRDRGRPQRASGEPRPGGLIACGDATRDLARDRHLQRSRRHEHDGEQAEQGRERAVVLTAEDASGREQEDVGGDDRRARRGGKQGAATRAAGTRVAHEHRGILGEPLGRGAGLRFSRPPRRALTVASIARVEAGAVVPPAPLNAILKRVRTTEVEAMLAVDERHWWYRGRRRVLRAVLADLSLPSEARLLDAGCGSGLTLDLLASFGRASGIDINERAVTTAHERGHA